MAVHDAPSDLLTLVQTTLRVARALQPILDTPTPALPLLPGMCYQVLDQLTDGPRSPVQLVRILRMPFPSLRRHVQFLQVLGWVSVEARGTSARQRLVSVTPNGHAACITWRAAVQARLGEALGRLSRTEVRRIGQALAAVDVAPTARLAGRTR